MFVRRINACRAIADRDEPETFALIQEGKGVPSRETRNYLDRVETDHGRRNKAGKANKDKTLRTWAEEPQRPHESLLM